MKLSKRSKRLIGQGMFQIKAQAEAIEREGKKLIHFEIGDTCFNAPRKVKKACIKAIKKNKTHYTDPKGLFELRQEIAEKHGVLVENVAIVPANFGIFAMLSILCDEGDYVEYDTPCFPTYKAVCKYLGLKKGTKKAKVKIVNFPRNPDGKYLVKLKTKKKVIFDMAYQGIVYKTYLSKMFGWDCVLIGSFSKTHAMPGFRVGYVIAAKEVIDKIGLLVETTYSCLPEFTQIAALKALEIKDYKIKELDKRRRLMHNLINKNKYLSCDLPEGAIYCWAKVKGMTGTEFFGYALKKGVVVCPGEVFGDDKFVRFCFAREIKEIKEGFMRLNK